MKNLHLNGKAPENADSFGEFKKTPMMLINEVSRLMGDRIRANAGEHPVGQKSGRLLLLELSKKDGRTQLDLVHATHLKAPTISVSLQKLEKEGYVTRRPDEYDLRATRVFLTDKGRELDNKIRKSIYEEESAILQNLTETECETLVRILNKIKKNLVDDSGKDGDLY